MDSKSAEEPGPLLGGGGLGGARAGRRFSLLKWAKGQLSWLTYQGIGAVLAVPVVVKLLIRLLTSPRKTLHRVDRSQLQLPDPLPGLAHEWIETECGIRLHAVRTSQGSGKPLMLLVHGFPEAWFSWRHQMAAFRDEYEVVAVDLRGYGESSKPAGRAAYRLDRLAGDVLAVAQRLLEGNKQEQLVLVGHDWGGGVCWAAAHTAPQLLSRLVIMCAPHSKCYLPNMDWDQFKRSWYVFAFQMPWVAEAALCANDYAMLAGMLTGAELGCTTRGAIPPQEIERYKQAFGRPGTPTAAVNYYRSLVDANSRSPIPQLNQAMRRKLTVPTLLLWGEKDGALGQQLLRGTERYVETLTIQVLPGCSHWVQQDQPEEVNRRMREFLPPRSKQ